MSGLCSLYDALVSINVPSDKARAVVDAMERDMPTPLVSKSDLESFRLAIKAELAGVKSELEAYREELRLQLELTRTSLTLRFGCMLIFGLSMFFAALKLTGS